MLDPRAVAITEVALPEGTHVVPPRTGISSAPTNPPALLGALAALLRPPGEHDLGPLVWPGSCLIVSVDMT